ncbi:FMN-dependent oxidoreductase, nitrilotriacetate monooxygenase family [Paenibacillus algorifonticola]|uniref:FMN-dependent oxidoreductase, nitrilotriacetate monooxygenase family n=1 Tax=Paenibacillus algorifonticola TaxID=684063 RepID=A0A1I2BXV1_9BACL|nr:LLM class flavin-dependent oxidoreductase [Paenibacillus algorifonticola]SFE60951.1 FMN-dependent oxidoreductase, nitrilotriacetate monooxygenase family [Paenibacillus algorifonticola]
MGNNRQMILNFFMNSTGFHETAWRHPLAEPEGVTSLALYKKMALIAEQAKFHTVFLADAYELGEKVKHQALSRLEPYTLLVALAAVTERIGLVATVSTSYTEPFHTARLFASLDHLSGGRAGWNIVTTGIGNTHLNFSREQNFEHTERYNRALEFVELTTKLWDSWEDDALLFNKADGLYADPDKIHAIKHKSDNFSVEGPLNLPRPPQGYPVLAQAGSSEDGKELAARTGELIYTAQQTLKDAQTFYADVKSRVAKYGRDPEEVKIVPGFSLIVGATEAEAKEKEAELRESIIPELGLKRLSSRLKVDLFSYPLDGPVPQLPDPATINENRSRFELMKNMIESEQLTIRQLIERASGGNGHRTFAGTAVQVADEMEEWFTKAACDGFVIRPQQLPTGLEDFARLVVPELQRRGLFHTEYKGRTLRENLGLSRPVNQFARKTFEAGGIHQL